VITPRDFAKTPAPITPTEQRAINVYANLMVEIRDRVSAIQALFGEQIDLSNVVRFECAFLQTRMILETLALACLVAHGDLKEMKSSGLRKAYQADIIVKKMDLLHPDFFPVPHIVTVDDGVQLSGRKTYHFEESSAASLTKADIISMYGKLGNRLHRGSLKALNRKSGDPEKDINDTFDFLERLMALLGNHHIMTMARKTVFVCSIPDPTVGDVRVLFAAVTSDRSGNNLGGLLIAEQSD